MWFKKQLTVRNKGRLTPELRTFTGSPNRQNVIQWLPLYVGIICLVYLWIGALEANAIGGRAPINWYSGSYRESYIAASLLAYSAVLGTMAIIRSFVVRKWSPAMMLIVVILWAGTWWYSGCFQHKLKGFIIWPM